MNWFKQFRLKLAERLSRKARVDWDDLLQKFTPRARKVIQLAEDYALSLHHPFVGTEHMLVGLIQNGDQGVAQGVLRKHGAQLQVVRDEVERIDGRGPSSPIKLMLPTPRIKRVFGLAREEADKLGHTHIGTEHLLLALLREGHGVGARGLKQLNLDLDEMIKDVRREIAPSAGSS